MPLLLVAAVLFAPSGIEQLDHSGHFTTPSLGSFTGDAGQVGPFSSQRPVVALRNLETPPHSHFPSTQISSAGQSMLDRH